MIRRKEFYKYRLRRQSERLIELLKKEKVGTDEISALLKSQIQGLIFREITVVPGQRKWVVCEPLRAEPMVVSPGGEVRTTHTMLFPLYATSMDAALPNENIVLLKRKGGVWHARQKGEKRVVKARDRILACRLAALLSGVWKEKPQKDKKPAESIIPPVDEAVE